MVVTIQLPDGTYARKPIDALQPEDMIVFDDTRTTQHVTYRPQPMDWDFDEPSGSSGQFEVASVQFEPKPGELRWDGA